MEQYDIPTAAAGATVVDDEQLSLMFQETAPHKKRRPEYEPDTTQRCTDGRPPLRGFALARRPQTQSKW